MVFELIEHPHQTHMPVYYFPNNSAGQIVFFHNIVTLGFPLIPNEREPQSNNVI